MFLSGNWDHPQTAQVELVLYSTASNKHNQEVVGESKKTEYGANLDFRKCTKEIFYWVTEDDLDGLIEPDPGSHPQLAADFQGVLLEEYTPYPVASVETKIFDPNNIATVAATNSGIKNTTGFYDDSNAPTPFFTTNPASEF